MSSGGKFFIEFFLINFVFLRHFSADASQTTKQMVEGLQNVIQQEFATDSVAKVDETFDQSTGASVGGLAVDALKESSLFEMFSEGLLCVFGPTEDV